MSTDADEQRIELRPGVLSAQEALRFLDATSAVLAASLAYEETLRGVARTTVPDVADWCGVEVVEEDGSTRLITSGHPDDEIEAFIAEMRERYRAEKGASEGTARVLETGEAELYADVRGVEASRVSIRPEERERYERLAPRSYIIVPLPARGRILGTMTLLSTREGRHYSETDLDFARHLGRRFALAIDNARLYEAAERSLGQLDAIFESAPVGLGFFGTDLRCVRCNAALAAMIGRRPEDLIGHTAAEFLGGEMGELLDRRHAEALARDEPLLDQDSTGEPVPGGGVRHWLSSSTPMRGPDGPTLGLTLVVVDVTERRMALEAEREARRRATFLAEAGAMLDRSLDFEQTVDTVARLAVPEYADWCTINLPGDDGRIDLAAVEHIDPARAQWVRDLHDHFPPELYEPHGSGQVMRTGRPEILLDITDDALVQVAHDSEHLRLLRGVAFRSTVIAPLQSRGRTLGAIGFFSAERRYGDADVELFLELGRRAGVAVENARLYTERSHIAHTLQARLLPQSLPSVPGVRLAARYRAAGQYNEVGGDFYDAFERAPGEWVAVIGDVSGKGPEAAALTALARYTIRSVALDAGRPDEVLARLNDTLLREDGNHQFVTVALAYLRPDVKAGTVTVRLVLGGHPLPYVLRASGKAEQVGAPGTLLGMRPEVSLTETETVLEHGDSLVLYTDGVIEAGPRSAPLGEDGLGRLLSGLAGQGPDALVVAVEQAALDVTPDEEQRDDMALLAVHAERPGAPALPPPLVLSRPAEPGHLRELREAVAGYAAAVPGIDVEGIRLAVGEACANAVMHAYSNAEEQGDVEVRAEATPEGLVVEVRDHGGGTRPRPDSPGIGLGMPLMGKLARAVDVSRGDDGGTVVRLVF